MKRYILRSLLLLLATTCSLEALYSSSSDDDSIMDDVSLKRPRLINAVHEDPLLNDNSLLKKAKAEVSDYGYVDVQEDQGLKGARDIGLTRPRSHLDEVDNNPSVLKKLKISADNLQAVQNQVIPVSEVATAGVILTGEVTLDALSEKPILSRIFYFLDPDSFSKAAQVCRTWNLTTKSDYFKLPLDDEELRVLLSQGVTKELLYRVTKASNGIPRLREFYLSYFKKPATERIFDLSDNSLVLSQVHEKNLEERGIMEIYAQDARNWQPFATALSICDYSGDPTAYKLEMYFEEGVPGLTRDQILYPFFKTVGNKTIFDEDAVRYQEELFSNLLLEISPYLLLKARQQNNNDQIDNLKGSMSDSLYAKVEYYSDAAYHHSTSKKEAKEYFLKAAACEEKQLQLMGEIPAYYKSAGDLYIEAGKNTDSKKEAKQCFGIAAAHYERCLAVLGLIDIVDSLKHAVKANFLAGGSSVQGDEAKQYFVKAALHGEKLLELFGDKIKVIDLRNVANANFKAGKNSVRGEEAKQYFVKAVFFGEKLLELLGDKKEPMVYGFLGEANYNASENSTSIEEKNLYLAKAKAYAQSHQNLGGKNNKVSLILNSQISD